MAKKPYREKGFSNVHGENRKGCQHPDPLHRPVQIPLLRVLLHHVHVNDQSLKIGKSLFCWKNCQTPIPCSPAWERSTSLICYLWNLGKYKWLSLFSDTTVLTFNFRKIMHCRLFWWCFYHLSVDFLSLVCGLFTFKGVRLQAGYSCCTAVVKENWCSDDVHWWW